MTGAEVWAILVVLLARVSSSGLDRLPSITDEWRIIEVDDLMTT